VNVTPEQMLKLVGNYAKNIKEASKSYVAVGLPSEKVGGKVYGDGMTVIRVGAIHEYGLGHNPRRSFLHVPFTTKKKTISKVIDNQFNDVLLMKSDAKKALGIIGIAATNIAKGAFTTRGYGVWPDIKQGTKKAKGSSQVLIDNRILSGSITSVVRS